jgi:hypothetical protein
MGIKSGLAKIFRPSGDTVKGIAEGLGSLAGDLRDSITGEENKRKVQQAHDEILKGLQRISELEVQGNVFQRSWRPALAWTIILALFVQYPVYMVASWVCEWAGWPLPPAPDAVDVKDLWPIILGLIGYRTIEKSQKL